MSRNWSSAAAFSSGSSSSSRPRSCISKPAAKPKPARSPRGDSEEAGSGVIIERRGKLYVLTNRHVIKYSTLTGINIKLADGRVLHPTASLGRSRPPTWPSWRSPPRSSFPARLGDSSKLEIGDFVLAVGSPFGLSHSVTYGIISAKGRRDLRLGDDGVQYQDFLQTDAAINPGNSGGPLLNLRGEVIGMNTAIASTSGANEGIGFAIPINMVMVIADQLIERGMVVRAYLGRAARFVLRPDRSGAARPAAARRARVTGITRNSPAEQARISDRRRDPRIRRHAGRGRHAPHQPRQPHAGQQRGRCPPAPRRPPHQSPRPRRQPRPDARRLR